MNEDEVLVPRDSYLKQLLLFKDKEEFKIVTGLRRSGKSRLLRLMRNYLLDHGTKKEQIIEMNFESLQFSEMSYLDVYKYVKDRIYRKGKTYIFLDEPHIVAGWEKTVNSFRADFDCDIYITGSNSYMLSTDYSTLLSGRYVEIKMYPLSFKEFIDFRDFKIDVVDSPLGGKAKRCIYKDGSVFSVEELFDTYMKYGGMPGLRGSPLNEQTVSMYLEGVFNTVMVKDVLSRKKRGEDVKTKAKDPLLLYKICTFLADNISKQYSYNKITASLNQNVDVDKSYTLANQKIQEYIQGLKEAFVFYEAKRYDIKGNELLKTNGKFYIVDLGFKNMLLGYQLKDRGFALENIVYFELLRRGYSVSIGKINDYEIDFRAMKNGIVTYIQVSDNLNSEETLEREARPFDVVKDHNERLILTNQKGMGNSNGIRIVNVVDWLLEE